jgi:hypothetical protein
MSSVTFPSGVPPVDKQIKHESPSPSREGEGLGGPTLDACQLYIRSTNAPIGAVELQYDT